MKSASGTDHASLLSQLHADLSARWGRGERARVEEYLAHHPHLAESPEAVVGLLYAELMLAEAEGESPTLSGCLARFPQHASAIERQWRLHELIRTQTLEPVDGAATTAQGPASPSAPAPPASGKEGPFPGLVLVGELGRGAMGDVHKAWQPALDRFVAVKTIRAGRDGEAALAARFRIEARAVGRLRHPGIVQVFDFGEAGGCLYLIMEYLPGGSLARALEAGPLEPVKAARTVEALARAVQAAHEADVIHRDLKPANVLLTADGEPKVGDFGVARLLDDEGQTTTGLAVGTVPYMAPEQTRGEVGRTSDVWALGVILYECLSGRRPFAGKDQASLLRAINGQDPEPPHPEGGEAPAGLVAICRACLRKQPEDRYATAGALAEDLGRWLAGQAVRPPAPEWTRRAVLGAGVAAVGGVGAWFAFAGAGRRPPEVKKTPREEAEEWLRQGKPYVLKGDEPLPGPLRVMLAGAGAPVPSPTDRGFSAETLGTALLELLTPPCDRYRFSVQVRHDSAGENSAVGLYCAFRDVPVAKGKRQGAFYSLTFDERSGEARGALDRNGRPVSKVRLASHLFEEAPGTPPLVTMGPGGGVEKPFQPTLPLGQGGPWRWLEVRVTPEAIRASWENNNKEVEVIGDLKKATVEGLLRASLLAIPRFGSVPTRHAPQAGLGLYVRGGKASFRRLAVVPVVGPE